MNSIEDTAADLVITKFNTLPAKSKPVADVSGVSGWVPLCGIVSMKGNLCFYTHEQHCYN